MNEEEKIAKLQELIDALCDINFSKDVNKIDEWIQQLNRIYANKYRHKYSDIFFKLQEIIAKSDSEVLETLGENLDVLKNRIELLVFQNPDNENLKITRFGYNKLADHINLEIGRYNFIRNQFSNNEKSTSLSPTPSKDNEGLMEKVEKLTKDVYQIRPLATKAQIELDKLDSRLESNKISSITTLTIFSAVVLAFSGGITYEVGMLQGMAAASAYRLVFVIALTGLVLFNTIFALLYFVGKLAGKSISTKCRYCTSDANNSGTCCGDGTCKKDLATGSIFCRIWHKYCYALIINIILFCVMYFDFFLWLFNGEVFGLKFILSQAFLLSIPVLILLANYIKRKIYEHRCKFNFKTSILQEIVSPEEKESNWLTAIAQTISQMLSEKRHDYVQEYKDRIKDVEYREALRRLNALANEQIMESTKLSILSSREHRLNKIRWKKYKMLFKEHMSKKNFQVTT